MREKKRWHAGHRMRGEKKIRSRNHSGRGGGYNLRARGVLPNLVPKKKMMVRENFLRKERTTTSYPLDGKGNGGLGGLGFRVRLGLTSLWKTPKGLM